MTTDTRARPDSARRDAPTVGEMPTARPSRELFGAPDVPTHRNPTVWLLAATIGLWTLGSWLYLGFGAPWWVATIVNAVGVYLGFTVLHESVHRVAHRNTRVNRAMGVLPALALWFHEPVFRICHTKHHANTNDPEMDPDLSVANAPNWLRPWWLLYTVYNYRKFYFGKGWAQSPRQAAAQIAIDLAIVGALVATILTGTAHLYLTLWIGPTLLAGLVLFYAFDFLPHHVDPDDPNTPQDRYFDTRIQPGRVRHALLLGQNYHLIHHLWVAIPWYRYRAAFRQVEADLRARGADIG